VNARERLVTWAGLYGSPPPPRTPWTGCGRPNVFSLLWATLTEPSCEPRLNDVGATEKPVLTSPGRPKAPQNASVTLRNGQNRPIPAKVQDLGIVETPLLNLWRPPALPRAAPGQGVS